MKRTSNKHNILLAAGGTGGHFFPALATANELHKAGYNVHFSTDRRCKKYIPKHSDINFQIIDLYIRSGSKLAKLLAPFKIMLAFSKALFYVFKLKPSVVIGFGGYPSFPTLLACSVFKVPIILHEQNRFLGKVNRFFAPKAKLIACSYEGEQPLQFKNLHVETKYVGDIVRQEIRDLKIENDYTHNPLRIFVFGGSQGAQIFAKAVPEALKLIKQNNPDFTCKIIHQATNQTQQFVIDTYKSLGIEHEVADFFHNIADLYQQTDLVIARSGASTIAELSAVGLPAIFIPLPSSAENHQYENAKHVEKIGGCWTMLENSELVANLAEKLQELNQDRNKLKEAANKISSRESDGISALVATVTRIVST